LPIVATRKTAGAASEVVIPGNYYIIVKENIAAMKRRNRQPLEVITFEVRQSDRWLDLFCV
jgi:hypothetical protein